MSLLGTGLTAAEQNAEALTVQEAQLSMERRLGASEDHALVVQGNLSNTYYRLGRVEQAARARRDVYAGRLKLNGEGHAMTLRAAGN